MFLEWDRDMYDPATDEPAKVNSSDLNEELGQIEILFSDKTGTLTENVMIFKEASINGVQYDADALKRKSQFSSFTNQPDRRRGDYEDIDCASDELENEIAISEFLTVLAVCHTVQVASSSSGSSQSGVDNAGYQPDEDQPDHHPQLQYDAASPDEKALVEACASFGVQFLGEEETEEAVLARLAESRTGQGALEVKEFQKLFVLEFDSTRKRMSVIVRYPCGKVLLVTKVQTGPLEVRDS